MTVADEPMEVDDIVQFCNDVEMEEMPLHEQLSRAFQQMPILGYI
jgi:hypothetical protein